MIHFNFFQEDFTLLIKISLFVSGTIHIFLSVTLLRGVSGYLKLGGQVVMWRATAAAPPPGGAFCFAKNWVGLLTLPTRHLRPCY